MLLVLVLCFFSLECFALSPYEVSVRFVNAQSTYRDPLLLQYKEESKELFTTTVASPDFTDFDIVLPAFSQMTFFAIDIFTGVVFFSL